MNFMFSEFKENRDVNTTDWDSKMDFWTALIFRSCRQCGSVLVNLQDLNRTFQRKEKTPLGLSTVLQTMARTRFYMHVAYSAVMQAYQAGVAALRLSLKDVSVERAESLVDQIQELCDTQDEVNQTISSGVTAADEDMDELEKELKALLDEPEADVNPPDLSAFPTDSRGLSGEQILSPLPAVPHSHLNTTTDVLEEELNRLTLSETGLHVQISSFLSVSVELFQTTCSQLSLLSGFPQRRVTSPKKRLEAAQ
ncbi:hypothetical protein XENOCAPTIV_003619 [Xenoophorus captivus]|uniref:Charged multivesicular body protein 7 n=1 Tax=Xenoophorus captivus TaxID=1517983 RepID=A0ABV0R7X4_9TELE